MRKCRNGWHLDDGMGWKGICSDCVLRNSHPTLRRIQRRLNVLRTERGGLVRKELLSNLHPKAQRMPMRSRLEADYRQAVSLLKEDLVWSGDFDNIRYDLMELIDSHRKQGSYPEELTTIVQKLIAEENDLSI